MREKRGQANAVDLQGCNGRSGGCLGAAAAGGTKIGRRRYINFYTFSAHAPSLPSSSRF